MNDHELRALGQKLQPRREALVLDWARTLHELSPQTPEAALTAFAGAGVDAVLAELALGLCGGPAAAEHVPEGLSLPAAYRLLDRALMAALVDAGGDGLGPAVLALEEGGTRRLLALLRVRDEDVARRLAEVQDEAAGTADRAREVTRANEALRRSEAQSHHRAEQIGLLASVAHRIAAILDPERLMQEAADVIRARMNHTFVAIVLLDNEGVLVGRWAGRTGVGRRSAGRTQGPAGGLIGRTLRKRAPQVVPDVALDPDYHPDVAGTRSEMVIPLLDGGEVVGAIDFQAETTGAFDLDDVAAGETLAEFLVVALRNARLFEDARRA